MPPRKVKPNVVSNFSATLDSLSDNRLRWIPLGWQRCPYCVCAATGAIEVPEAGEYLVVLTSEVPNLSVKGNGTSLELDEQYSIILPAGGKLEFEKVESVMTNGLKTILSIQWRRSLGFIKVNEIAN